MLKMNEAILVCNNLYCIQPVIFKENLDLAWIVSQKREIITAFEITMKIFISEKYDEILTPIFKFSVSMDIMVKNMENK